jgi:iron-sulfur cluster assembly protein
VVNAGLPNHIKFEPSAATASLFGRRALKSAARQPTVEAMNAESQSGSQSPSMKAEPRARRPRPQIVRLTESAAARLRDLTNDDKKFVRVGVKNGGCAGMEYYMEYVAAPDAFDELVEEKGVKILVESKAVLFLLGSEVDFETTALAAKFVFRNPNETDACGCGESVTIIPVKEEA